MLTCTDIHIHAYTYMHMHTDPSRDTVLIAIMEGDWNSSEPAILILLYKISSLNNGSKCHLSRQKIPFIYVQSKHHHIS